MSSTDFNLFSLMQGLALSSESQNFTFPSGTKSDTVTSNVIKNSVTLEINCAQIMGDTPFRDWYLLQANVNIASAPGVVHNDPKRRGPYLSQAVCTVRSTSGYGDGQLLLYEEQPETYQGQTDYSKAVSGSIGGSLGFFGEALTGAINGGASFSNTVSYDQPDLMIADKSVDQVPQWLFTIAGSTKSGPDDIDQTLSQPSDISTTTLELEMSWVWQALTSARVGDTFGIAFDLTCTYEYRWVDITGAKTETSECETITWPVNIAFPPPPQTK